MAPDAANAALPAPEKGGPDIMTYVIPVLRSWLMISVLAGLGAVGGVLFSLTKPNEYTSIGKLQVGQRMAVQVEGTQEINNIGHYMGNWEQLFANPELSERVAEIVGPHEVLTPYDPAASDKPGTNELTRTMHEWQSWWFGRNRITPSGPVETSKGIIEAAGRVIRANISTVQIRNTQVFQFAYTSHDKELAQRVVKTFMEMCKKRELEWNKPGEEELRVLTQERDEKKAAADVAKQALFDYYEKHNIHDYEQQVANALGSEQELRNQIHELEADLRFAERQLALVDEELKTTEPLINIELPDRPIENLDYGDLRRKRSFREQALENAREGHTEESEKVQRAIAKLAETQKLLDETPRWIIEEGGVQEMPNPTYTNLRSRQQKYQDEIREHTARLEERRPRLPALVDRAEELRSCKETVRTLREEQEYTSRASNVISAALERGRIHNLIQVAGISRLRDVQAASLPLQKSGPKRLKFVLAGLAAGLAAGVGIAAVRGLLDRTIRRPKDLEDALGVKVLGVVPYSSGWKRARRNAQDVPNDRMATHV